MKINVVAFLLLLSLPISGMHTRNFCAEYKPASSANKAIAQEAIKNCGVTEPVTILEGNSPFPGATAVTYKKDGKRCMVLFNDIKNFATPAEAVAIKTFSAHHECGHIVLNHTHELSVQQRAGVLAIGAVAGYRMWKKIGDKTRWKNVTWGGIVALRLNLFFTVAIADGCMNIIRASGQVRHEKEADIFAAQKLVANGRADVVKKVIDKAKSAPIKSDFGDFLYKGVLRAFGIPHASPKEQARYLTECLPSDKN